MPAAKPNQLSMTLRFGWALTAIAVIAWAPGCAAPGPRGVLPFGEWSGDGTYVYEAWGAQDEDDEAPQPRRLHRSYPTTLSIRPDRIDEQDIVVMEIRSKRGAFQEDSEDTETHLLLALLEGRHVGDNTVLYRVVDFAFCPGMEYKLHIEDDAPPVGATCTDVGDALVFQIPYKEGFFDTIRFRGNRVEKWGVFFDEKSGLIQWAESLTRTD